MSSTCFTQSCEQVISGRYQTYDRIIEILQNEEYLEYANTQFVDRRLLLQVNRSNKQTRSRHKRGLAGRGIFRDYINEYLFPDAEVKPNSGLIFSLILAIVAVPLLLSTARALPEIRAGQAPPSSPQPGIDYNGGDRMDNLDNIYLGDALSLVPQGFKTVAVFPPFAQERTVPAVAAIFSESPQYAQRRRSKRGIMSNWERNMLCLRPRISRYFRGKRDAKMDSSDDCFEDVDEPLYGYVVNLQLKQEEPCDLRSCLSHLNVTNSDNLENVQTYISGFDYVYPINCKVKNTCG